MEGAKKMTKREPEGPPESMAMVPVSSPAYINIQSSIPLAGSSSTQQVCPRIEKPPPSETTTLMAVNIKQIIDGWRGRKHNSVIINNTVSSSLRIIGRVTGRNSDEYKGNFKLDNSTGAINASIWFTGSRNELDCIPEGAYAMAVGRLKPDTATPELQCFVCRAITNFNDITHHHLSVIATHIDLVLKPRKTVHARVAEMWEDDRNMEKRTPITIKKAKAHLFTTQLTTVCPIGQSQASGSEAGPTVLAEKKSTASKNTEEEIMKILRDEADNAGQEGVHIRLVSERLLIEDNIIRPMMAELESAGEVYSTIDGDHFAPT